MTKKPLRDRLDIVLVARDLAPNRSRAQALVLAGRVHVNGQRVDKPGTSVPHDAPLEVTQSTDYVSRGGHKLSGALDSLGIDPSGLLVLDAGASTGGFTDVLLQRGALKVYAVDVGYGQLDWRLRNDPRVVVMERTNVRHLKELPEPPALVTADLSFISLTLVLPAFARCLTPAAEALLMVKPQFELSRNEVGRGGVVRDDTLRIKAVDRVAAAASELGFLERGRSESSLAGPKGNREIFLHLIRSAAESP